MHFLSSIEINLLKFKVYMHFLSSMGGGGWGDVIHFAVAGPILKRRMTLVPHKPRGKWDSNARPLVLFSVSLRSLTLLVVCWRFSFLGDCLKHSISAIFRVGYHKIYLKDCLGCVKVEFQGDRNRKAAPGSIYLLIVPLNKVKEHCSRFPLVLSEEFSFIAQGFSDGIWTCLSINQLP